MNPPWLILRSSRAGRIGAALLLLALALEAHAKTKTLHADANAARLKALEQQAAESRAKAAELARRTAQMQKDLEEQRQSLTEAAADVRTGEQALSRLEDEQAQLAGRYGDESLVLERDRAKLARLTAGLVRLSRIPPGGLLAWSQAPIDAARAEMLLGTALSATRASAKETEGELERLEETGRALDAKRKEATHAASVLTTRRAALQQLVDRRQSLYRQTDSDRQAAEARAQKIADEAKDLRDLVARIEAEQAQAEREAARRKTHVQKPQPPGVRFAGGAGLPIAGEVKARFGQDNGLGTTARGITIVARPGATVTAPAAGTVRYAGPFRGYREILILEHSGGYLSLIAGMARINVAVGTSVGTGEPVGTMDERPDARPELYYELRRNGQPVDPEAKALPVEVKGKAR